MLKLLRRLAALALCLLLPLTAAPADTVTALDGSGTLLETLPMDDYAAFGRYVDPEDMGDDGYSDASIQVSVSHEWIDGTRYNVARVRVAHASQLRTALYKDNVRKAGYVWTNAADHNAVVAIGGECLSWNDGVYTVRMSQTLRTHGIRSRDTLIIDQNGDFHITKGFSKDTITQLEEQGLQIVNLFNFGPALVIDGEAVYDLCRGRKYPVGPVSGYHPRTAIGQLGPLEYLLVVADGRNVKITEADGTTRKSQGINVYTLGEYMAAQGCVQAYTLDGGGSAVMYYGKTGTYSQPCSKRGVTDIIYFASLSPVQETAE